MRKVDDGEKNKKKKKKKRRKKKENKKNEGKKTKAHSPSLDLGSWTSYFLL